MARALSLIRSLSVLSLNGGDRGDADADGPPPEGENSENERKRLLLSVILFGAFVAPVKASCALASGFLMVWWLCDRFGRERLWVGRVEVVNKDRRGRELEDDGGDDEGGDEVGSVALAAIVDSS